MGNTSGLKRCPRCGGNIFLDKDYNGWYIECLQCSYTRDLNIVEEPGQRRLTQHY